MNRTWNGLDVVPCPRCGDRMRLVAAVEDQATAHQILRHLGLATRAPPRGRPWRRQREFAVTAGSPGDAVDSPASDD